MRTWRRVALLGAAMLLIGRAGPPLYDGLGFPDDPYRFVGHKRPPASAHVTLRFRDGASQAAELRTPEHGPQFKLVLDPGALTGATAPVTLTGTPIPAAGALPRGVVDSNAYRVAAAGAESASGDRRRGAATLRAAVMTKPAPVIVFRPTAAAPWRELPTSTVGVDNLRTSFVGLGDYAVERLPGAKAIRSISGSRLLLFGVDALVVLVGAVWLARRFGRRGEPDSQPS